MKKNNLNYFPSETELAKVCEEISIQIWSERKEMQKWVFCEINIKKNICMWR